MGAPEVWKFAPAYELPSWPFVAPPDLAHGERRRYPVVIAGGGLAGLTLACDLALRGIAVVVLDEDDTVGVRGASSRGICYAQKSLEIFARLGIYERIREKGITWSVGRTFSGDDEIYSFNLEDDSRLRAAAVHQPAAVLPRVVPGRSDPRARRRGDPLEEQGRSRRARQRRRGGRGRDAGRRATRSRPTGSSTRPARTAGSARLSASRRTRRATPTAGASPTSASRSRSRPSAGPGSTRRSTRAAPSGST